MLYAFLSGIILALGLIMPLGVQNIFLFNQGATQRHFLHALPSVLTATCCDAILIICAVLGVSVFVLKIVWLKTAMLIIGFFFLLYMGFVSWYSRPKTSNGAGKPLSAKSQMLFTASASLFNPHALLDTIGVIGTSSLQFTGAAKGMFSLACIITSGCWFFGLSVAGHFLHKLDQTGSVLHRINKLSALIMWSIAFYIALQLFY
jgi:L-lysine exporter family protein LysE/ArgO